MWRMSGEDVERECKTELDRTLRLAHKLTENSSSPAEVVLHKLNAVLCAAVDSNFGDAFTTALEVLYRSIGRLEPETQSKDRPILHIARNCAAVIAEAVRQRNVATTTVSPPPPYTKAEELWSGETPNEDLLLVEPKTAEDSEVKGLFRHNLWRASTETTPTSFARPIAVPAAPHMKEVTPAVVNHRSTRPRTLSTVVTTSTFARPIAVPAASSAAATVAAAAAAAPSQAVAKREVGSPQWREGLRRKYPHKILDFTYEAVEGRVSIYHLPQGVRECEVRQLLQPFGEIKVLFMGAATHRGDPYALAKLESNRAADDAVARLNNKCLRGARIMVKRLEYLSDYRAAGPKFTWLQQAKQQHQPLLQRTEVRDQGSKSSNNDAEKEIKDQVAAPEVVAPADVLDSDDEFPQPAGPSASRTVEVPSFTKLPTDSCDIADEPRVNVSESSFFSVD